MNVLDAFTFVEIFLFTLGLGLIGVGSLALLCFTLACPPGDDPPAR
jgi:hypothetical protein